MEAMRAERPAAPSPKPLITARASEIAELDSKLAKSSSLRNATGTVRDT